MNILAELIPGARQLRTPLAIGYLWLAVAWVNSSRFERYVRKNPPLTQAIRDLNLNHLSPTIVVLSISFGAYLIGMFFQILGDILVAATIISAIVISLFSVAIAVLILALLTGFYMLLLIMLAAIALLSFGLWSAKKHGTDVGNEIAQLLINATVIVLLFNYAVRKFALKVWSPATAARNGLESRSAVDLLDMHPETVHKFCRTLSSVSLRSACIEAGLYTDSASLYETSDGNSIKLSEAAARSWVDPESDRILRDYLRAQLLTDRPAAASVILRVVQASRIRNLVRGAVADAETRIRAQQRVMFEDSDRLRAEGEFRRGVAIPLAAMLSTICSFYTSLPALIALAAAPMILLYASGLKKEQDSAAIIVSCITAGIADLKVEDLNDVRLLRWRTRENANEDHVKKKLSQLFSQQIFHRRRRDEPEQGRLF
jgi:hypothetical protein